MADEDDDDLDSLLDQVEQTFSNSNTVRVTDDMNVAEISKNIHDYTGGIDQEIDSILEDLGDIQDQSLSNQDTCHSHKSNTTTVSRVPSSKSLHTRCVQIVLTGSDTPLGCNQGGIMRSCSALRCTSCDLSVVVINGYKWLQDSDYLFFRNNYPDVSKLKGRLRKHIGYRAYACQCSWRAVRDATECSNDADLKWVCGGHKAQ
jgi:hypothetical protein